jgi:hypothetical protein
MKTFDQVLGFFDADGNFSIYVDYKKDGSLSFRPFIEFSQKSKNKDVLEQICKILGYPMHHIRQKTRKGKANQLYSSASISFSFHSSEGQHFLNAWKKDPR